MGTPEERLRQKAQALQARRQMRERQQQVSESQRRADLQERSRAASAEAQAWLGRAREMIAATQMRVPLQMNHDLPGDDPGFELAIGTATFRAVLQPDGWHVVRVSPRDLHTTSGLPTDLSGMRETVLERMVEQGLEDLDEGRMPPAPEWGR